MQKVKVRITKTDIKNGTRHKSMRCPIALAVKRKTGINDAAVGVDGVWIGDCRAQIRLQKKVNNFVHDFDNYLSVKPFQFTMYIP